MSRIHESLATAAIAYAHIDDLLGPSEERFFGAGYKRSSYVLSKVSQTDLVDECHANIAVKLGGNWSLKGNVAQVPHIGTTDVINVFLALNEIAHRDKGTPLSTAVVADEITIVAPPRPVEKLESSAKVVLHCEPWHRHEVEASLAIARSNTELFGFRVSGRFAALPATDIDFVASEDERSFWTDGFKATEHTISEIRIAGLEAAARFKCVNAASTQSGIDAIYRGHPSIIDVFVAGMQLGQALIYGLDDLTRAETNTLWLRSLNVRSARHKLPTGHVSDELTCAIKAASLLGDASEKKWRLVTLEINSPGLTLTCRLAHQLRLG